MLRRVVLRVPPPSLPATSRPMLKPTSRQSFEGICVALFFVNSVFSIDEHTLHLKLRL